jgi:hypothetical protein
MASTNPSEHRSRRAKACRGQARHRRRSGFEPIRIAADDDVEEERVPLFYIGDDEYTIPKDIPRGVALQYLRHASEVGHELATAPLLIRVLGEDAYMALEQSKAMKRAAGTDRRHHHQAGPRQQEKEGKARRG